MKMKKIKIFLASSLVELKEERNELARFILGLNNNLIDNNAYVELQLCEEMDAAFSHSRKQDEYNAYIQNADYVFFLFLSDVGQYTREEFEIAYAHFKKHGTPRIFTYFYKSNIEKILSKSNQFADELSQKYGHYYCVCNNLETVKLALLLQISKCFAGIKPLTLKDGRVCLGGMEYLSFDQTDTIAGNREYQEIVKELAKLDERIEKLAKGGGGKKEQILECNERKSELLIRKNKIEEQTLSYIFKMYEDIVKGNISRLKTKVYRLVEQGKIKEADQLLDMATMDHFRMDNETAFEEQMEIARECIDLYQQKIMLAYMQKLTPECLEVIHECYRKIREIVERTGRFENALIPYVHFLEEMDIKEIDAVIEYVQWCHMKPRYKVPLKEYCDLCRELLRHYELNQNQEKGKEILGQLVQTVKNAKDEEDEILYEACDLIQSVYGNVYPVFTVLEEITYWQEKALDYAENTGEEDKIAHCYKMMGIIAGIVEEFEKMEACYMKALRHLHRLYEMNPEKWAEEYVNLCSEYGNVYANKAAFLRRAARDVVSFEANGGDWRESMTKALTWDAAAAKYYKDAYEFALKHAEKFDTFKNRLLLCKNMKCIGACYEQNRQGKEASDIYWDYINALLEVYESAPYEAAMEIMQGFLKPIGFWIYHHVWGDAEFALEKYEEIVKTHYVRNPEKYAEYLACAKELRETMEDEREWGAF